MEVKIGVRNAGREVVLESGQTPAEVEKDVAAAFASGEGTLRLVDDRGRIVLVPVSGIAYVEIGAPESRRVGFAS